MDRTNDLARKKFVSLNILFHCLLLLTITLFKSLCAVLKSLEMVLSEKFEEFSNDSITLQESSMKYIGLYCSWISYINSIYSSLEIVPEESLWSLIESDISIIINVDLKIHF